MQFECEVFLRAIHTESVFALKNVKHEQCNGKKAWSQDALDVHLAHLNRKTMEKWHSGRQKLIP